MYGNPEYYNFSIVHQTPVDVSGANLHIIFLSLFRINLCSSHGMFIFDYAV